MLVSMTFYQSRTRLVTVPCGCPGQRCLSRPRLRSFLGESTATSSGSFPVALLLQSRVPYRNGHSRNRLPQGLRGILSAIRPPATILTILWCILQLGVPEILGTLHLIIILPGNESGDARAQYFISLHTYRCVSHGVSHNMSFIHG